MINRRRKLEKHRQPPLLAALTVTAPAIAVAVAVNLNGRDVMEKLATTSIWTNHEPPLVVCFDDCQGLMSVEKKTMPDHRLIVDRSVPVGSVISSEYINITIYLSFLYNYLYFVLYCVTFNKNSRAFFLSQ